MRGQPSAWECPCGALHDGAGLAIVCGACGLYRAGWRAWLCFVNCDLMPVEDGSREHAEALRRHMVAVEAHDVEAVAAMPRSDRRAWGMTKSARWRGED